MKFDPIKKSRIRLIIQDCEERLDRGLVRDSREKEEEFRLRFESWKAAVMGLKVYAEKALAVWPED